MVSTYTTNKRIEKPGNGDYVDTWNVPVNADFDIIDAALGSTTAINVTSVSGGVALTPTQYQKAFIAFSGVLTANVTYGIPAGVGGQWTIVNLTTGAFTLKVVSLTGGGTETTLLPGFQIVSCDGTNTQFSTAPGTRIGTTDLVFGVPTTTINGLTLTNVTIGSAASPVPVAAGGTGRTTIPAGNVLIGAANGTDPALAVAPGAAGNVLTSVGGVWASASPSGGGGGGGIPVGGMMDYGGATAPTGWLLCDGSAVSRTAYAALFTAIGTSYGAGNGTTTFNIPDRRGRGSVGKDNMGGSAAGRVTTAGSGIDGAVVGASGGAQNKTLGLTEMPTHSHTLAASVATSIGSPGTGGIDAGTGYQASSPGTTSAGGGQAFGIMNPTLISNVIIYTGV